jgi:hypothetical protein
MRWILVADLASHPDELEGQGPVKDGDEPLGGVVFFHAASLKRG